MKFTDIIKNFSPLKLAVLVVFILYLILPIQTPPMLASVVDSPLGIVALFVMILYLFFYTDPVLAILFIFVSYELLRRSSHVSGKTAIMKYTPSQEKKDAEMVAMNPVKEMTVEEEIIEKMAPIRNQGINGTYVETGFKPVADKVSGSLF